MVKLKLLPLDWSGLDGQNPQPAIFLPVSSFALSSVFSTSMENALGKR
jgi:hypothetical protein